MNKVRMLAMASLLTLDAGPTKKPFLLDCENTHQKIEEVFKIDGFKSEPLEIVSRVEWPDSVSNPLNLITPTFDDGPNENDLKLIQTVENLDFQKVIFYYIGEKFIKDASPEPGGWMNWIDENCGDLSREEYLLSVADNNSIEIAKKVLENGYEIGFHGMQHQDVNSPAHMQNMSSEVFSSDLEFFEWMIQVLTANPNYKVKHVRPPYGAGISSDSPFVEASAEHGAEARNWSFSSFDWEKDSEVRGDHMIGKAIRASNYQRPSDILYHSPHQTGIDSGSFAELLDVWSGIYLSLLLPERAEEIAGYKKLLQNMNEGSPLISSSFQIGSSGQILLDSSYLNGLDVEWAGVVQSQFDGQVADGFFGAQSRLAWESQYNNDNFRSPNLVLSEYDLKLPDVKTFEKKEVTFANRGLQVKKIANDIICNGGLDENFLSIYRFAGLHIEPDNIGSYIKMQEYLQRNELDEQTSARILATALLESGMKNSVDEWFFGKGEVEGLADSVSSFSIGTDLHVPFRLLGLQKEADILLYGINTKGLTQVNIDTMKVLFSLILGEDIDRESTKKILDTPEGAAFATYLLLRQQELRMSSELH
mgnify:CR=1 FL=1